MNPISVRWLKLLGQLLSVCALAAFPVMSTALTWNLQTDWSETANPNGPWSLNAGNTSLPHISGSTLPGGALVAQPGWALCDSCRGFWFKAIVTPPNTDWLLGDIVVHTQDQGSQPPANVTWTSPVSGFASVSGSVWMDDFFPSRGNQWNLYIKGVLASSGQLTGTDPYSRSSPFNLATGSGGVAPLLNIPVNVGDIISLELVRTTSDGFFIGTNLSVSAVPEPTTLIMMMIGTVLLAVAGHSSRPGRIRPSDA